MLNLFINSTTLGQAMGASFDMDVEGTLADKRITEDANCEVIAPIYRRAIDANKVAELVASGQTQKVSTLSKAIDAECVRVNTLSMLIRELELVAALDSTDMIVAYVPTELLGELQSGRVKMYIGENATANPYFSELELGLWAHAMELIQSLYHRLIFKNIAGCKKNSNNDPVQALRGAITGAMYGKLLTAFREMKNSANVAPVATGSDSPF